MTSIKMVITSPGFQMVIKKTAPFLSGFFYWVCLIMWHCHWKTEHPWHLVFRQFQILGVRYLDSHCTATLLGQFLAKTSQKIICRPEVYYQGDPTIFHKGIFFKLTPYLKK